MIDVKAELAAHIDQTLLRPSCGIREIARWAEENRNLGFAALCIPPVAVPVVSQVLAGSTTAVCTVVGFPFGNQFTEVKVDETQRAVLLGAHEIDVVIQVGALLEGDDEFVLDDLQAVVASTNHVSAEGVIVKAIIETGHLDEAAIRRACAIATEAGVDFVKTGTGFGPRGATIQDVEIMREACPPRVRIKAAGGIRDLATASSMIKAGADRIGTSSGAQILETVLRMASDGEGR